MAGRDLIRLGLIGDNIASSRSPLLHRIAGRQHGLNVSYELLIPNILEKDVDSIFYECQRKGYRGLNITYPYKEHFAKRVEIEDPLVRNIGAVNTIIFDQSGAKGYNTDYSGFISAYRAIRSGLFPGKVLMIGTGGVGRAIAFGLVTLGVHSIRLVDKMPEKAEALAEKIISASSNLDVSIWADAETAASGRQGVVNSTPVGMIGHEGTPLPAIAMKEMQWAFDAVYTPANTPFLTDAKNAGLTAISGWELFLYQGMHAWSLFSGLTVDKQALRQNLLSAGIST